MKNTKLTKHMKHNIAKDMRFVYHDKNLTYWYEFASWIAYYHPSLTHVLHWDTTDIQVKITDTRWFRNYVLTERYH